MNNEQLTIINQVQLLLETQKSKVKTIGNYKYHERVSANCNMVNQPPWVEFKVQNSVTFAALR
ncbi:MAG: hypothetical protein ACFB2X_22815 [Rivularia sp. (in: cyanobacteria)]